jgi:NADP-dependent 3-hydroxy acid dehydrogenase YdfG
VNGPLAGRMAVVSGASRGIGLAISRMLIAEGARVAMLARGVEELERRARELGRGAFPVLCDVGRQPDDRFGGSPDVVVSNAGLFQLAPVETTAPDEFARSLDVNLVAPFLMARAVVPEMRSAGRGDIVTIGSIADRVTFRENGAYAAAKFGARALHQVLREELRGTGVRVTLVSPGPVDTALWDPIDPDSRAGFTPRSRMLRPEAVADAVRFALTREQDVDIEELRLGRS